MAPVISGLSAIFLAPLLALLLGRAVLVEVVEFAAGEHIVVGPLAVCFLKGPLSPSWHDRETGRGGVAAAEAVATTRAPSLSRCATMMASSWSRTWGGGSSISRLNLFHFRQSRVPKVQNDPDWYEIERENLHGLVVVYSQLYWAPSLPSRAKAAAVKPRCSALLQKHPRGSTSRQTRRRASSQRPLGRVNSLRTQDRILRRRRLPAHRREHGRRLALGHGVRPGPHERPGQRRRAAPRALRRRRRRAAVLRDVGFL